MGIEITGYRVLYNKSIAGRGIARFISWLGTAGPVDFIIEYLTVILEYIDLFQFLLVGYSQLLVELTVDYATETRYSRFYKFTCMIMFVNWNTVNNTQC